MEAGGSWDGKVEMVVRGLLKGGKDGREGRGVGTEDEAVVAELLPDSGRGLDRPGTKRTKVRNPFTLKVVKCSYPHAGILEKLHHLLTQTQLICDMQYV